jgi:hypothetical protein
VNPPCNRKSAAGNPPPTVRAPVLDPTCERLGVRFPRATHLVLGFQHKSEAEQCWQELAERLRKFRLELHPDKTRLLEFGPFAVENRMRRGQGKPETFDFLGFSAANASC